MRRVAVAVLLLLAGCTSPAPPTSPPQSSLAFVASRVDTNGDGLFDAVNVTLLAAPEPLAADRITFQRDGETLNTTHVLEADVWRTGAGASIPCDPGLHEFSVALDGRVRKVIILECGVAAPREPPLFQGRIIDGDADGRPDAVELQLLSGGPIRPESLTASLGGLDARIYDTPFKSRLARAPVANGSQVFTPCHPERPVLNLTWQSRPLPGLRVRGCEMYTPGVDVPLVIGEVDLDEDRVQDAWNLTLGESVDGPFDINEVRATWDHRSTNLTASVALVRPPDVWTSGASLVATCPGGGTLSFALTVRDTLVFRSVTVCEEPPGRPLLELNLTTDGSRLLARLTLSRLGMLDASRLTTGDGASVGEGSWPVGETRALQCPGGRLVLRYGERLAYDETAPC